MEKEILIEYMEEEILVVYKHTHTIYVKEDDLLRYIFFISYLIIMLSALYIATINYRNNIERNLRLIKKPINSLKRSLSS